MQCSVDRVVYKSKFYACHHADIQCGQHVVLDATSKRYFGRPTANSRNHLMVKARYHRWFLKWLVQMDHRATQRHNLNFQPDVEISDEDDSVPTVLKTLRCSN